MNKKFHIHLLSSDQSDISAAIKKLLLSSVYKHVSIAAKALSIKNTFNITIYPNSKWTISHTGDGGYTPSKDWVQLYVDLTNKKHDLTVLINKRLPATIYHEMNHLKRWASPGFGHSLLESIVSEGIACAFEYQMWKTDQTPLFFESEKKLLAMLRIVKKFLAKKNAVYIHSDWFYGTNPNIPKWLGYKLGYYLIVKALENNPKKTLLDFTSSPYQDIVKYSGLFTS